MRARRLAQSDDSAVAQLAPRLRSATLSRCSGSKSLRAQHRGFQKHGERAADVVQRHIALRFRWARDSRGTAGAVVQGLGREVAGQKLTALVFSYAANVEHGEAELQND